MAFPPKRKYVRDRKEIPDLPWLPVVTEHPDPPSVYVSNAFDNQLYPPLMIKKSWTRAVPYKVRNISCLRN